MRIGNVRRRVLGVALAPSLVAELASGQRVSCQGNWEETQCVPDLALLRLSRPVRRVKPPALSRAPIGRQAIVVGRSQLITEDEYAPARLRAVQLRVIADTRCRRWYGRLGPEYLLDLPAQDTLCARDAHPPRSAGVCIGEDGAPFVARRNGRWSLLGIGSWKAACGEGDRPWVFADVWPSRAFIQQPAPTWRPVSRGYARLSGIGRVGQTLTCQAPHFDGRVEQLLYWFVYAVSPLQTLQRSPDSSYVVRDSDHRKQIECWALAINAGGTARAVTNLEFITIE